MDIEDDDEDTIQVINQEKISFLMYHLCVLMNFQSGASNAATASSLSNTLPSQVVQTPLQSNLRSSGRNR